MLVACVVEGQTEYYCLPPVLAKLGHAVIPPLIMRGSSGDWAELFRQDVVPRVRALRLKQPNKILVVLDREKRPECPPELARQGLEVINGELAHVGEPCPVAVVVANRHFECVLFADYMAVDNLNIANKSASELFGDCTDGKNVLSILRASSKPNTVYHKTEHGPRLARQLRVDEESVVSKSRCLRKLIKEVPRAYVNDLFH